MTSPFKFKYPFPSQTQPNTLSTQLSPRNFILRPLVNTPSSLTQSSNVLNDDIDDNLSDLPRKRVRRSSIQDFSSSDEEELPPTIHPGLVTPTTRRPPVLLQPPSPESSSVDFSPSRRHKFLANGLAAYFSRVAHEFSALSSVAMPSLDREDVVVVEEVVPAEGGLGWICRVSGAEGEITLLLVESKGLSMPRKVSAGNSIAFTNAVKLKTVWLCPSWRNTSV
jgi:hypothetical protein